MTGGKIASASIEYSHNSNGTAQGWIQHQATHWLPDIAPFPQPASWGANVKRQAPGSHLKPIYLTRS